MLLSELHMIIIDLVPKTRQNMVGSHFVAAHSGESICRQISFLNDFENQRFFLDINFVFFSKFFHLSIQRRSFDSAGLLYHSNSTLGPGRLPNNACNSRPRSVMPDSVSVDR